MTGWKSFWRTALLFSLLALPEAGLSQSITISSGFISDSTKVGEDVFYYLAVRYPRGQQLVFPDTTFTYSPFELHRKDYFPTTTKDTISYDSAVYALRTFELDAKQTLRLPVFVINSSDCTRVYSNRDTVAIKLIVPELPDSTFNQMPLKATTEYYPVPQEVNVPLIIGGVSLGLALVAVGWVVLGPAVRQRYHLRMLKRSYQSFIAAYDDHLKRVASEFSRRDTEASLGLWKKYMENLNRRPYTKLTARETELLENDRKLGANLKTIDSAIYGSNTNVVSALEELKTYAHERYKRTVEEVTNG